MADNTQTNKQVLDFFVKVSHDQKLTEELDGLKEPDQILLFANRQGYNFSLEELKAGVAKIEEFEAHRQSGELSVESLDSVVGGSVGDYIYDAWYAADTAVANAVHKVGSVVSSVGNALQRY